MTQRSNNQVGRYYGSPFGCCKYEPQIQKYEPKLKVPVGYKVTVEHKVTIGNSYYLVTVENKGTCKDDVHQFVESKKGYYLYCEKCGVKSYK